MLRTYGESLVESWFRYAFVGFDMPDFDTGLDTQATRPKPMGLLNPSGYSTQGFPKLVAETDKFQLQQKIVGGNQKCPGN